MKPVLACSEHRGWRGRACLVTLAWQCPRFSPSQAVGVLSTAELKPELDFPVPFSTI